MQTYYSLTKVHLLKVCFGLIFSCFLLNSQAQYNPYNLVTNPSFEQYTVCPTLNEGTPPSPWYYIANKKDARYGYRNACANGVLQNYGVPYSSGKGGNYQESRTGVADVGNDYFANFHTYIQAPLKDSLISGRRYYVEFFENMFNSVKIACNNHGLLFTKQVVWSDTSIGIYNFIIAQPQIMNYGNPILTDTANWVKISGIYKAQGGEKYITIGNFFADSNTKIVVTSPTGVPQAAYLLDDVSVIPLDSFCLKADAGKDTTITIGDSIFIGSYTNGIDSVKWLLGSTVIDSVQPGFWVKPTITTSYVLHQVVNGCFSSDTVVLTVKPLPLKFISFSIFPSNGGVRGGFTTANEINVSHYNILRSINGKDFTLVGKVKANNKNYNEYQFTDSPPVEGVGVGFYYRIQSIDKDGKINYSETRIVDNKKMVALVQLYPNPSKGLINVTLPLLEKGDWKITVIDVYGKTVLDKKLLSATTQLNIAVAKGIYFANVVNNLSGKQFVSKLIIE